MFPSRLHTFHKIYQAIVCLFLLMEYNGISPKFGWHEGSDFYSIVNSGLSCLGIRACKVLWWAVGQRSDGPSDTWSPVQSTAHEGSRTAAILRPASVNYPHRLPTLLPECGCSPHPKPAYLPTYPLISTPVFGLTTGLYLFTSREPPPLLHPWSLPP